MNLFAKALKVFQHRQPKLAPWLFLAPTLLVVGAFQIAPVFFAFIISVMHWDAIEGLQTIRFVGLENYQWVFLEDDWFGGSLGSTLWSLVVSGVALHLTAIPLAFLIQTRLIRQRTLLLVVFFLPFLMSGTILQFVFSIFFGNSPEAPINALLLAVGNFELLGIKPFALFFPTQPIQWLGAFSNGPWLDVFLIWWHYLGWNLLLYVAALQSYPKDQSEAARMDGANVLQELVHVTVPHLRPMIFFASTLTVVIGITESGNVGGYMYYLAYDIGDFGAACVMGVILLVLTQAIVWGIWYFICQAPDLTMEKSQNDSPLRLHTFWQNRIWAPAKALAVRWLASPPPDGAEHLRGFDGMRALACSSVLVHHLGQRLLAYAAIPWLFFPAWSLAINLNIGVSLFFVLSGALLSMPFWNRYLDHQSPPDLLGYFARRAARIAPGYWFALIVCFVVALYAIPDSKYALERSLAGFFFVSSFHYISFFPSDLNGPFWSISLEVICYGLLPLLLLPAWRLIPDRSPRRTMKYLMWVLIGLQLAHFLIVALFPTDSFEKGWQYGNIGGAKEWLPHRNPATFMTMFMLGSCASFAIAWRRRLNRPILAEEFERPGAWALLWMLLVCFFLGSGGEINPITRQPYVTPLFPAICAAALYLINFSTKLAAIVDNRISRFIAKLSFGIYLWHFPVIELIRIYVEPDFKVFGMKSFWAWAGYSLIVVAISLILAALSWYLIERPVLNFVQRWLSRRKERLAARKAKLTLAPEEN